MDKDQLKAFLCACREAGRPGAVSFCSHVPQEILEAAGFTALRLMHTEGVEDISQEALPKNLCPVVRNCYSLCQSDAMDPAELIIAESSCDGKKKMYELLTNQERLYYYQVPQGEEQEYSLPLIRSECRWLIRMLRDRFNREVTEDALRNASALCNQERSSVMSLMALQMQDPPAAWGLEILETLEKNRLLPGPQARAEANLAAKETLSARVSLVPKHASRILVTGCPAGGVYRKVIGSVEKNGGVAVCFENCEVVKANRRHVDMENPDILDAIARCYLDTACAIMTPNSLRFRILEDLIKDYRVDGILDLALQPCHAYTVEQDKMRRFCAEHGLAYLPLGVDYTDSDIGQIETRIAAFLEML